jgi:hypothetical protein
MDQFTNFATKTYVILAQRLRQFRQHTRRITTYLAVLVCVLLVFSTTPLYPRVAAAFAGPVTTAASDFSPTPYMTLNGAVPVHWPVCSTIGYRLNLTYAPPDAKKNVEEALALLSRYTRFRFVAEGTTTYIPQENWTSTVLPAQLTIAWATPATSSLLGQSQELSIGSVASKGPATDQVYADAVVVMDATATKGLPSGMASGALGLLLLHELSHAVGLAHSHNPHSYMYPYFHVTSQSVLPSDIAHLAAEDPASC